MVTMFSFEWVEFISPLGLWIATFIIIIIAVVILIIISNMCSAAFVPYPVLSDSNSFPFLFFY